MAPTEHDLGTLSVAPNGNGRIFSKGVVLGVPIKDEFSIIHLPNFALLFVSA